MAVLFPVMALLGLLEPLSGLRLKNFVLMRLLGKYEQDEVERYSASLMRGWFKIDSHRRAFRSV